MNPILDSIYNGDSANISMEEIYGIDYNSSIYQFTIQKDPNGTSPSNIDMSVFQLFGLNGSSVLQSGLLRISLLTSSEELCGTFILLWDGGVKKYHLTLSMYAEKNSYVSMRAFMSLPNQARSIDQFLLLNDFRMQDKMRTFIDSSVYSLKLLQKRNTAKEPCIDVDNYDKVCFLTCTVAQLFWPNMQFCDF
jgi:hypothetical protein